MAVYEKFLNSIFKFLEKNNTFIWQIVLYDYLL